MASATAAAGRAAAAPAFEIVDACAADAECLTNNNCLMAKARRMHCPSMFLLLLTRRQHSSVLPQQVLAFHTGRPNATVADVGDSQAAAVERLGTP